MCLSPDFPGGSDGKASAYNAGDLGSIPGLGRSPGEGNGDPLQSSCLENPMNGGTWEATAHGVAKSPTRLSDFTLLSMSLVYLSVACIVGEPPSHSGRHTHTQVWGTEDSEKKKSSQISGR